MPHRPEVVEEPEAEEDDFPDVASGDEGALQLIDHCVQGEEEALCDDEGDELDVAAEEGEAPVGDDPIAGLPGFKDEGEEAHKEGGEGGGRGGGEGGGGGGGRRRRGLMGPVDGPEEEGANLGPKGPVELEWEPIQPRGPPGLGPPEGRCHLCKGEEGGVLRGGGGGRQRGESGEQPGLSGGVGGLEAEEVAEAGADGNVGPPHSLRGGEIRCIQGRGVSGGGVVVETRDVSGGSGLPLEDIDVLSPVEALVHLLQELPCLESPPLQPHCRLAFRPPASPLDSKAGVLRPCQLDHRPPGPLRSPEHLTLLPPETLSVGPHKDLDLVLDLCLQHQPPVKRRGEGGGGGGGDKTEASHSRTYDTNSGIASK